MSDAPSQVSAMEVAWRLQAHEERTDRVHEALDHRITEVASGSLTIQAWQLKEQARDEQQRAMTERIQKLEAELERRRQDAERETTELERERAKDRRMVIAAFLSPLLLLVLQLYLSSRGAK